MNDMTDHPMSAPGRQPSDELLVRVLRARSERSRPPGLLASVMDHVEERPHRGHRWRAALSSHAGDRRLLLLLAAAVATGGIGVSLAAGSRHDSPIDAPAVITPATQGKCSDVETLARDMHARSMPPDVAATTIGPAPSGQVGAGPIAILGSTTGSTDVLIDPTAGLPADGPFWDTASFSWSPNGKVLAAVLSLSAGRDPACSEVVIVRPPELDGPAQVYRFAPTRSMESWVPLGWTPDGSAIAAVAWTHTADPLGTTGPVDRPSGSLRLVPIDGSAQRDLGRPCDGCEVTQSSPPSTYWEMSDARGATHEDTDHAWSPDGKELLVRFSRGTTWGLAAVSIDDGSWRIVAEPTWADIVILGWRPDGMILAHTTPSQGVPPSIRFIPPAGQGQPTAYPIPGNIYRTFLSPDFRVLAVVDLASTSVSVFDLGSDVTRQVVPLPPQGAKHRVPPILWSPDGRQLAIEVSTTDPVGSQLWIADRDGSDAHHVADDVDLLAWQPVWR